MDIMTAINIVEGIEESEEYEVIEAWQTLVDTGVAWQLQGSYGRMAIQMIEDGVITNNVLDI